MSHRISITLPTPIYKKLEQRAAAADMSISGYAHLLIQIGILRLAKAENEQDAAAK